MCHPPTSLPPDLPADLPLIFGGAGGSDVVLTSEDATRFRAYLAKAGDGERGVVIAPDVRGLHPFYEELAERFASAGLPDIASAIGHLRGATDTRIVFVVGFCMGGRQAFYASAEHVELAGVIGFYGRLSTREGEEGTAPKDRVHRMRAPILGLFGGADPGIPETDVGAFDDALKKAGVRHHFVTYPGAPHSFFDRTFVEHRDACDDAWRRVLGFMKTGDPSARACPAIRNGVACHGSLGS